MRWKEERHFETAKLIKESGTVVMGFAQRGTPSWHTMYTGYATQYWSMGAVDFDKEGKCAITSEKAAAKEIDEMTANA